MGFKTENNQFRLGTFMNVAGNSPFIVEDHTVDGRTVPPNADTTYSLSDRAWTGGQLFPSMNSLFRERDKRSTGEANAWQHALPDKSVPEAIIDGGLRLTAHGDDDARNSTDNKTRLCDETPDHADWGERYGELDSLTRAVKQNNLKDARELLEGGVQVDNGIGGDLLLHLAVERGNTEMGELLLQHGAPINKRNIDGWTPLHFAMSRAHEEYIRLLLKAGADPGITNDVNKTPADLAPLKEWAEAIIAECAATEVKSTEAIIDGNDSPVEIRERSHSEADPDSMRSSLFDAVKWKNLTKVRELLAEGADADEAWSTDWSILHAAAQGGSVKLVRRLIDAGANINIMDRNGETPLNIAVTARNHRVAGLLAWAGASAQVELISGVSHLHNAARNNELNKMRKLLADGNNPNVARVYGITPLHEAAQYSGVEMMKLLIDHGASVKVTSDDDWTPLHVATRYGDAECVELLINANADVDAKDDGGWTALHHAARYGDAERVRFLIGAHADVEARNERGSTPLHMAGYSKDFEIVRLLLEANADVNAKDKHGAVPLHRAARFGGAEHVRLLLDAGADVNVINDFEETPLDASLERKNGKTAGLIVSKIDISALMKYSGRKLKKVVPNLDISAIAIAEAKKKATPSSYIELVSSIPKRKRAMDLRRDDVILSSLIHFYSLKPTDDEVHQLRLQLTSRAARKSFDNTIEVHHQLGRLVPAEEPSITEMIDRRYVMDVIERMPTDEEHAVSEVLPALDGPARFAIGAIYLAVMQDMTDDRIKQKLVSLVGNGNIDSNVRALALWAATKLFDINGFPVVGIEALVTLACSNPPKRLLRVVNWVLYTWQRRGIISAFKMEMLHRARYDKTLAALSSEQSDLIVDLAVRGIITHANDVLEIERCRKVLPRIVRQYLDGAANPLEGLNLLEDFTTAFPQVRDDDEMRNLLVETLQDISAKSSDALTLTAVASLMRTLIFTPPHGRISDD